jgi:hypothetical protein
LPLTSFEHPSQGLIPEHSISLLRQYLLGFYYTTLTMATLGYGDISPANSCSRLIIR